MIFRGECIEFSWRFSFQIVSEASWQISNVTMRASDYMTRPSLEVFVKSRRYLATRRGAPSGGKGSEYLRKRNRGDQIMLLLSQSTFIIITFSVETIIIIISSCYVQGTIILVSFGAVEDSCHAVHTEKYTQRLWTRRNV